MSLSGRRVLLGVTGGIAAYKTADLVRLLVREGATVRVVMTAAAERFITPLTLETLSGQAVGRDMFALDEASRIGHIRMVEEADLLLVAPATADIIARLAAGLADDLLATLALVARVPLLLAPSMNVHMWTHPQTQANLARLVERGALVVGPDTGELACGTVGAGRLADPPLIVEACRRALGPRDLDGHRLLITAGPTHEPLDPVRFLGNRSSGRMGFALARRAAARGASVTLVAGPVALDTPGGVARIDVRTALEMRDAVAAQEGAADCVIMAAAVADFRPAACSPSKIKKGSAASMTLALERNPDILAELGERRRQRGGARPLLVGFAAETGDLLDEARAKLARKGCDLLVANDVTRPGSGFGTATNEVIILEADAPPEALPLLDKERVADRILDRVARRLGDGR